MNRDLLNDAAYSTVNLTRRKNRNLNRIWLLTKIFHWSQVDVSLDNIKRAGGTVAYYGDPSCTLDDILETQNEGIRNMKMWCQLNSRKKWKHEPANSFFFQRVEDAVIFKMRWC